MTDKFLDVVIKQIVALVTFFAFPALRYVSLKWFTRKHGNPELWYLPKYGFRLVIRNLPSRKTLSEIKYRVLLRRIVPASAGISVATLQDTLLHQRDDFFLFGGTDQILAAFRLERTNTGHAGLMFVLTDKLGQEQNKVSLAEFERLICDYVANVKNYFNFDIKVERRVEIKSDSLRDMWASIQRDGSERGFALDRIRDASTGRNVKAASEVVSMSPQETLHRLAFRLKESLKDGLLFLIVFGLLTASRLGLGGAGRFGLPQGRLALVLVIHDWTIVGLVLAFGLQCMLRLVAPDVLPRRPGRYILYLVALVTASAYGVLFSGFIRSPIVQVVLCAFVVSLIMIGGGVLFGLFTSRRPRIRHAQDGEV